MYDGDSPRVLHQGLFIIFGEQFFLIKHFIIDLSCNLLQIFKSSSSKDQQKWVKEKLQPSQMFVMFTKSSLNWEINYKTDVIAWINYSQLGRYNSCRHEFKYYKEKKLIKSDLNVQRWQIIPPVVFTLWFTLSTCDVLLRYRMSEGESLSLSRSIKRKEGHANFWTSLPPRSFPLSLLLWLWRI